MMVSVAVSDGGGDGGSVGSGGVDPDVLSCRS